VHGSADQIKPEWREVEDTAAGPVFGGKKAGAPEQQLDGLEDLGVDVSDLMYQVVEEVAPCPVVLVNLLFAALVAEGTGEQRPTGWAGGFEAIRHGSTRI
jgi:hypothetical protein